MKIFLSNHLFGAAAAWWCERRLPGSSHRGESEAGGQPASLASTVALGDTALTFPASPASAARAGPAFLSVTGPVQPSQFSMLEYECQCGAGRPTVARQPGLIWPGIYLREQLTQLCQEARDGRKEVSFLINPYWEAHYIHTIY